MVISSLVLVLKQFLQVRMGQAWHRLSPKDAAARVEAKADMQRYNTLEVSDKQKEIVGPTFDFICNKIFEEDKP